MVGPERPQIVLFGSSIVQLSFNIGGWGTLLASLYARKADIVLRGYNSWNSRRAVQILDQVFPKDSAIQPSLVIVYFGGNDSILPNPSGLGSHVPLSEYVENMKKIAFHLKGLSKNTRVIFLGTPPINEEQIAAPMNKHNIRKNELCREYSEACLELCRAMDIKAIDLWNAIQKKKDWQTTCFIDGIHFTSEASKLVVKEILEVLREVDWEPSLYFGSMPSEFGEDSPQDAVSPNGETTMNASDSPTEKIIAYLYGEGVSKIAPYTKK